MLDIRELRNRQTQTLIRWWKSINSHTCPKDFPVRFDATESEPAIGVMRQIQEVLGERVVLGKIKAG